jgi:phosphoglycolate phosphatase-like HAD superfamily hydrolase
MHITCSDQEEFRYLGKKLKIDHIFWSIHGSPKPKKKWIKDLIEIDEHDPKECVLIGDSLNNWETADYNKTFFKCYNNDSVEKYTNVMLKIPNF